jgi:hypothetical protein
MQPRAPDNPALRGRVLTIPAATSRANGLYVGANDPLITEWIVRVAPFGYPVPTSHSWQIFMQVETGYGGAILNEHGVFLSNGSFDPMMVPVHGRSYQVHGDWVRAYFTRATTGEDAFLMAEIVPGRLVTSKLELGSLSSDASVLPSVPVFTCAVQVVPSGGVLAGDTLRQYSLSGAIIEETPAAESDNNFIALNPLTAQLDYHAPAGQVSVVYRFEVQS